MSMSKDAHFITHSADFGAYVSEPKMLKDADTEEEEYNDTVWYFAPKNRVQWRT